jgi:Ca2+-binding RTX toxin-like protein
MRIHRAALVVAVLASLILTLAGPAQAKRMLGTKGSDRLVGTAEADVIKARGGNDRVKGGRGRDRLSGGPGRDRLFGGRGADRLNAVDGLRDRLVRGGPGKDVCRVDPTDRANTKGCETVKIANGRGPGARGPGSGGPGAPGPGAGGPGGPLICATPP